MKTRKEITTKKLGEETVSLRLFFNALGGSRPQQKLSQKLRSNKLLQNTTESNWNRNSMCCKTGTHC